MIYKVLINISKKSPDLFFILSKTTIEVLDSHPFISSAALTFDKASKKFKIILIKDFIETFDLLSLSALIEHEVLHIVLNHLVFGESFDNKKLANIAFDSIINDIGYFFKVRSDLDKKLQDGIFLEDLNKKYKLDLNTRDHDSIFIYNALKDKIKNEESHESFDQHLDQDESGQDSKDFFDSHQKDLEKLSKNTIKKSASGSAIFKSFLDKIERQKRDKQFFNALNCFISSQKTNCFKSSLKKPSKRHQSPFGKIKIKTKNLRLLLDVSGSMLDEETILKIKKTIGLCTQNNFKVDLVFGDTKKVGDFKNINKNFDFSLIDGGGGTNLKFMFESESEGKKYDVNIVVTDLDLFGDDLMKAKKRNTLILSTTTKKHESLKTINI